MDPVTHTLFGANLADSGLRRASPLAAATLIIGANLPDLDFFTYFLDADLALYWRRGWSHGVLAMIVLPPLLAAGMMAWDRRVRRRRHPGLPAARFGPLLALAYLGTWSHPALDWLNTYGVRLLMPFSGRWFYGDTLFIIDPFLWLVLGGAIFLRHSASRRALGAWAVLGLLMAAVVLTAVPSQLYRGLWFLGLALVVGLRLRPPRGLHLPARAALATMGCYLAFLMVGSHMAESEVRAELADRGIAPVEDLMVGPLPASPLRRDVVVQTPEGFYHGNFAWNRPQRLELIPEPLPRLPQDPVVDAALGAQCVKGMVGWLRFPTAYVAPDQDGHHVWLLDARYARRPTTGFGTRRVWIDDTHEPVCDAPLSQDTPSGGGP